jgi:hypothetical protein
MQNLIYDSKSPLSCGPCNPCNTRTDVIICLDKARVLSGERHIKGTVISGPLLQACAGHNQYRHIIAYDETELVGTLPLTLPEVKGVLCAGCWSDYIDGKLETLVDQLEFSVEDVCPSAYFTGSNI